MVRSSSSMSPATKADGCAPVTAGWLGVATDLLFAAGLALLLSAFANDHIDAAPRPLALLALFGAPGLVAAVGVAARQRSIVAGAGLALLVGAPLSFTGVTAIFLIPALVLLISGARLGSRGAVRPVELAEGAVVAGLLIGAGLALFRLTADTCSSDVTGASECGSGVLTITGVAIELALQVTAIAFALWRSRLAPRLAGRSAS